MAARRSHKTDEENFRGDITDKKINTAVKEVEQKNATFQPSRHYNVSKQGTREISSMSMIDPTEWQLEDSQEPYALKDGTEALLRIIEVHHDTRPDSTEYYTVRFEVPSETYSKDITDWFSIPNRSLDAKRLNAARQKMLHFMECFGIDMSRPSDPAEDWVGQEGWCILSLSQSEQYGEQNRITKFLRPR